MSLFASSPEKGVREWKTFSIAKHDHTPGGYRVAMPRIVHIPVQPAAAHYHQFFILKNAH
jgi:hypothetical protein